MLRNLITPPLVKSFKDVYQAIAIQPSGQTPMLETTGGITFFAEAKITGDGREFISLPHGNRIYEGDWGYVTNSMGKEGQRIGQYSIPLDRWGVSL